MRCASDLITVGWFVLSCNFSFSLIPLFYDICFLFLLFILLFGSVLLTNGILQDEQPYKSNQVTQRIERSFSLTRISMKEAGNFSTLDPHLSSPSFHYTSQHARGTHHHDSYIPSSPKKKKRLVRKRTHYEGPNRALLWTEHLHKQREMHSFHFSPSHGLLIFSEESRVGYQRNMKMLLQSMYFITRLVTSLLYSQAMPWMSHWRPVSQTKPSTLFETMLLNRIYLHF